MSRVFSAPKIICGGVSRSVADWISVSGGRIAALGKGAPPADAVRLDGVVLPGLIDSHVHLTTTGLYGSGLDFRECRSIEDLLETLEAFLRRDDSTWVIGGNFDPGRNDDGRMPGRDELDRVAGERRLLVSRADGHSCALNSHGLEATRFDPQLPGIELDETGRATGVLSNQANYEARRQFFGALPAGRIVEAQKRACDIALSRGVTAVHEMAGGSFMGDKDFDVLIDNRATYPIHVRPYLATFDINKVIAAGLDCVGGDLFLDGSIGSRTAAMSTPYTDFDGSGFLYHADDELIDWFVEASRAGLQAGVHAIGDAAIEQALRCIEAANIRLEGEGSLGVLEMRHRIEHFECVSTEQLNRAAKLKLIPSVQPMFDGYWGGNGGMYQARLLERASTMNPFLPMVDLGLMPAGGSDSTVTPLDPLMGMAAAMGHHQRAYAVEFKDALDMFTIFGARAAREETERGSLEKGKFADFCVVETDPSSLAPDEIAGLKVLETWVRGERAFSQ